MSKALWGIGELFHDETTKNKQRVYLGKTRCIILYDIGFDKYPESHSPEENICHLV